MLKFIGSISLFLLLSCFTGSANAADTCLEVVRDSTFSYWKNKCDRKVYVNWNDSGACKNWSCSSSVGPLKKVTATITRKSNTNWCEWYNGATGRGPCKGSAGGAEAAASPSAKPGSSQQAYRGGVTPNANPKFFEGRWSGSVGMMMMSSQIQLNIRVNGTSASGRSVSPHDSVEFSDGRISGNSMTYSFAQPMGGGRVSVTLTRISDNTIKYSGGFSGTLTRN